MGIPLAIQDEKSQKKKAYPTLGILAIVEKEGRQIQIGPP
jgi:hypothetical protein